MNTEPVEDLTERDREDGIEQQVVGAVIRRAGRVLLLRRRADDFRGGTWELPSGKVEEAENLVAALRREVLEETGLEVTECLAYLGSFDYLSGSGRSTRQHTFAVTAAAGDVLLTEHDSHHWARTADDRPFSLEVHRMLQTRIPASS